MGLERVGWCFTHLPRDFLVSSGDIRKMARLQNKYRGHGKHGGSMFSTLVRPTAAVVLSCRRADLLLSCRRAGMPVHVPVPLRCMGGCLATCAGGWGWIAAPDSLPLVGANASLVCAPSGGHPERRR